MLSKVIFCLLLSGCVYSVFSASYHSEPYQHPDYPGQCYDKETNEPVAVGKESNNLMGCKSQICKPDFRFAVTTCAPFSAPPGCTPSKPDFTKRYPKCCPQPVCSN